MEKESFVHLNKVLIRCYCWKNIPPSPYHPHRHPFFNTNTPFASSAKLPSSYSTQFQYHNIAKLMMSFICRKKCPLKIIFVDDVVQADTHSHTYTHLYAQYWISAFVCRTCGRARTARVKLSLLFIVISKHTAFSLVLFNVTLHDHRLGFPWWSDCLLMTFAWFTTVLFRFACITQLAWSKMIIIFSNPKGLSSEFHSKNAISIEML